MKNYGELQAEIASWLDREDLTVQIPSFIRLAETKAYRVLRTRENEFQKTWDFNDDPFNPIELPQNYRQIELLTLDDLPLEHVSNYELANAEGNLYQGAITRFAIIERKIVLQPWPNESQTEEQWAGRKLSMIYYGTESIGDMATWLTPLNPNSVPESEGTPSDTTERGDEATTRLLLVAPDVLLYGALAEGYRFLREPALAMEYKGMFVETITDLNMEHATALFSGSTSQVSNVYGENQRRRTT
jgi:hypothetical protein